MRRQERVEKKATRRTLCWLRREYVRQRGSHQRWEWFVRYGPPRPMEIGHLSGCAFYLNLPEPAPSSEA